MSVLVTKISIGENVTSISTSSEYHHNHTRSLWIQEGIRRVRNDQVVRKMHFLTGMAAIGGFLFGYDTGVISGAMLPIRDHFALNHWQQEVVVSSTVLAAFASISVGGIINSRYGRRNSIRIAAAVFTIGSIQLFAAWSYYSLVFGRIIVGIGIGIASLTTPVYIAEVATPSLRGKLVTVNAFMVTFGQFIAGMVDGILMELLPKAYGWRYMLGLAALPSILMLIGFLFYLPESPRWLAKSNQADAALFVLKTIRDTDKEAVDELNEILRSVGKFSEQINQQQSDPPVLLDNSMTGNENEQTFGTLPDSEIISSSMETKSRRRVNQIGVTSDIASSTCTSSAAVIGENDNRSCDATLRLFPLSTHPGMNADDNSSVEDFNDDNIGFYLGFKQMLADVPTRRALILGCGLMLIQQFSGVNTVMYYAASIYAMSQFNETTAVWLSGFTALAQVVGVAASIYLVDRVGRRTLVLTSLSLVSVALVGLGFTFYFARVSSDPVKQALSTCEKIPNAWVWSGITSFCYDCANIDGCGYCAGICSPGDYDGPFDVNVCPIGSDWIYKQCKNPYGWFSVFFMVSYLLAFGIGMGGLPWTINSEIYSLRYRSLAVSCSTATNWISNLVVAITFLSISKPSTLTAYGSFWMYSSVALFGSIWLYYYLPETKGLALEDIERLFRSSNQTTVRRGYDSLHNDEEEIQMDDDVHCS